MKTDKTKLLQDIEAMKEKLAAMEKELNKPEEFKHFPSDGDVYYYYTPMGTVCRMMATDNNLKVNAYRTEKEAQKAYNKAVAIEKVKRRVLELQGDWKPNWKDNAEEKMYIRYYHNTCVFESGVIYSSQSLKDFPYIKNEQIAELIIYEMGDELKLIFDIA